MSELDDVVREFLVESYEGLDQLDRDLVALEQDPTDRDRLSAIFRCIHTIKGTCGFLGFGKLEKVAHVGENLLSLLRDGKLVLNPEITSGLLRLVDAVREMLAAIENTGAEGDAEYADLQDLLTRLARQDEGEEITEDEAEALFRAAAEKAKLAAAVASAVAKAAEPAPVAAVQAEPAPAPVAAASAPAAPKPAPVASAPAPAAADAPPDADAKSSGLADTSIRVDVQLLDKLMNLVGELVLARNQVLQFTGQTENAALQAASQRLNLITTELQEGVMKTRMQPIGNVWSKFPRVVRDLSRQLGKQVALVMEGAEIELDKTIIEAIKDPLTHIVRNSVDHGFELPSFRVAAGKPAEGRLVLRAFHEGGQVNIEIVDDGGGIDGERVKQKALDKGLITPEQAARMAERELQNLIFLPGFSTAEKVTNVSGRGVGMDVVRTNIEKIGGTVDIVSTKGQGTTLKIKIPLTLAIIPALTVSAAGDRYAIPQVSLLELVRLDAKDGHGIEMLHGAPVYRLRGNLLPLCYLSRELGRPSRTYGPQDAVNIVVLQADDRQFGLVVDEIHDTEEIVVKPLGAHLKGLSTFAGATIMGDGRVALILDVLGVAQKANVIGETRDRRLVEQAEAEAATTGAGTATRTTLLVISAGAGTRMAIPLSTVARLEEIDRAAVEHSGGREVVQYRGEILPLVRVADVVGAMSEDTGAGPLQVVVYQHAGRHVGLVVDAIVDIVEDSLAVTTQGRSGELLGTVVIHQKVTDLLDVEAVVRAHCPWVFDEAPAFAGLGA
jgi:two-component system chemotaxis sensor kinase CheA